MKKPLLSLALALGAIGLLAQDLSNGLLLHYDFNENANDVSGNNMHATVYGATLTTDKDGNSNSAYYFDGVDDYIELPNDNFLKPSLPLTIAFLAKYDSFSGTSSYATIATDYVQNSYHGIVIHASNGYINMSYGDGDVNLTDPQSRRSKSSDFQLQENTWYHVTCIVRGETDMSIYVDCIETGGTYSGTGGSMAYSSSPGVIGQNDPNTNKDPYFMKGTLDEIRYWNRALTQAEVELLCPTLSAKEYKDETLLKGIYPNPSNGEVTLIFNSNKSVNVEIVDVSGRVVKEFQNYKSNELKIKNLNQGLYFIKVYNDTYQSTQRVVVTNN